MASGRLGKTNPSANTITTVYQVPAGYYAAVTASFLNYSEYPTTFRFSILESGNSTPVLSDFLEYDTILTARNIMERSGIVLGSQQKLVVSSSTTTLIVNVFGIETQV